MIAICFACHEHSSTLPIVPGAVLAPGGRFGKGGSRPSGMGEGYASPALAGTSSDDGLIGVFLQIMRASACLGSEIVVRLC